MYRFTMTIAAVAMALGFQTAHAASPQDAPSVVVHFADIDLARSEGAAVLYHRLKVAAETVCYPLDDRSLPRHWVFKTCVRNTIGAAVARIDRPALTAYYKAQQGERNATIAIARE